MTRIETDGTRARHPRLRPRSPGIRAASAARIVAVALLGIATGCAHGVARQETPAKITAWTPGELQPVDIRGQGILMVRPDHELGRYDALLVEYVGFRYSDDQPWLSFEDEDRVHSVLTDAIAERSGAGVRFAEEADACVLSVRFYVTDLELYDAIEDSGSSVRFVRSFGQATMIMELRDSLTQKPLARFLQRRRLGGGRSATGGTGASIQRLRKAVSASMRDMGEELRRVTPPSTRSPREGECGGDMMRVAFGAG